MPSKKEFLNLNPDKRLIMKKIETSEAPKVIGPYSQAVISGSHNIIFVSGQLPVDPKTGMLIQGDMQTLTTRVINNLEAILHASGSSLQNVLRTDVFMTDLKEFSKMNEIYAQRFNGDVLPARQTVQISALPLGASIEISCIAFTK